MRSRQFDCQVNKWALLVVVLVVVRAGVEGPAYSIQNLAKVQGEFGAGTDKRSKRAIDMGTERRRGHHGGRKYSATSRLSLQYDVSLALKLSRKSKHQTKKKKR